MLKILVMPTFKITIYLATEGKMEGEKWHPSHDLEKVNAHYTKLAVDCLGKSRINEVKVIMMDNDAPNTFKRKDLNKFKPVDKRRDIYTEKPPLKDRNKR